MRTDDLHVLNLVDFSFSGFFKSDPAQPATALFVCDTDPLPVRSFHFPNPKRPSFGAYLVHIISGSLICLFFLLFTTRLYHRSLLGNNVDNYHHHRSHVYNASRHATHHDQGYHPVELGHRLPVVRPG